ncbi:thiol-disulfide oxidoreductase DCC family protein [Roseomonas sp. CCTCC AB2023176]|uniref:thiol-disulfide oxidoreductase DCC family protein n=1 Tax=Roseomonas sp. CCTCC AB2023176 TaxID=3342640 RepID=UPI0035E33CD5
MTARGRWASQPAEGVPDGTILYDGVCILCSGFVRFVAARDGGRFTFVPVQSPWGEAIARRHGISPDMPETNAVVLGGTIHFKSDAGMAVLGTLPGWGWARAGRMLPKPLRDWLYDRVARNRYRLFGRTETCELPPPGLRARVRTEVPADLAALGIRTVPRP